MEVDGRARTLVARPGTFLAEGLAFRDGAGAEVDAASLRVFEGRLLEEPRSEARLVQWEDEVQGILLADAGMHWLVPDGPGRLVAVAPVDLPGDTEEYLDLVSTPPPDCGDLAADPMQPSFSCLPGDTEDVLVPVKVPTPPDCSGVLAEPAQPDFACLPGDTEEYLAQFPQVPDPVACTAILGQPLRLDPDCLDPLRDSTRRYDVLAGFVYDEEPECQGMASGTLAEPLGLAQGWSWRTLDLAVALDDEAIRRGGTSWPSRIALILGGIDALYARDLQLRVRVVDLHAHPAGFFRQTAGGAGLDELKVHYQAEHAELRRDAVHFFTGRDIDGAVAGVANCIGGVGNETLAFSWGEYTATFPQPPFWATSFDVLVPAHEIGHILRGEHHLGNCAESTRIIGVLERCTLMFPVADPNTMKLSISNRLAIRGYLDEHDV